MAINTALGSRILARELQIQRLLANADLVGGIFTMGFDSCTVLTNDLWKHRAGGIPQHCFLLAAAMTPGEAPHVEDEEVILLRVIGPAPLPAESELVQVREEAMREMVTRGVNDLAATPAIIDVLTRNEIQFSGLKAKILGTFYDSDVDGAPLLAFGSDVETFYASSRYRVYKPYGDSLAIIASYPEVTEQEIRAGNAHPHRVQIGTIRYSSARRRRENEAHSRPVPVRVNVDDFVALKTAVFGMTRLGKSNTMKTIATEVCRLAALRREPIGQLLFDPAGEYANVNQQDATALSAIGPEFVTIFRYGAGGQAAHQPNGANGGGALAQNVRPLSFDFFAEETIEVAWSVLTHALSARGSDYIQSFLAADVIGPANPEDDRSAYERARRRRSALYGIFAKANFPAARNFVNRLAANQTVIAAVNAILPGEHAVQTDRGVVTLRSPEELMRFWDALIRANDDGQIPAEWLDVSLQAILAVYRGSVGTGFRLMEPLRVYHAPGQSSDYAAEVLRELTEGKVVIVDLSLGTESVVQYCSERIITHIVQEAAKRFAANLPPHRIQIFIEEAHRLFDRDRMKLKSEADPYVRLAKEAAKFQIGLIYATQEVSSVDPLILSNTSNWVVTHLNNQAEVRELAKYYDFADFSEITLRAEDVGFARVKTRSGRYIVPTQIDLFDDAKIRQAREAALQARGAATA